MVIVQVFDAPTQPFAVGVTVMVAKIGLEVAFVPVKAAISPEPLAAKPILGLSFTQL
jgi:hypothetical protein